MKKKRLHFSVLVFLVLLLTHAAFAVTVDLNAPVTLDIKGMDILDVLKIISLRSGLSIAASPLVKGKVTFFLKEVSVWDAFEILIAANDLAYEKRGDLINVMTNREYGEKYGKPFYDLRVLKKYNLRNAKAESLGKTFDELKSGIGKVIIDSHSNSIILLDTPDVIYEMDKVIREMDNPLETIVVQLNYTLVEDIQEELADLVTKDVGTIKFDKTSNRVVITDISGNARHVERVIKAFDRRPQSVQIEAKIIDITLSDEYRYGVDWGVVFGKQAGLFYDGTLTAPTSGAGIGKIAIGKVVFNENQELNASDQYRGLFKLFNTFGKIDVLSSPKITVMDRQEAYILVGAQEPVISITQTFPEGLSQSVVSESVQYVDTGVQLRVTPYISDEGYIKMKIKPEVSSAEIITTTSGGRYPKKTISETETTVIIKDGATIVLAGLMKETDTDNRERVPGLAELPLIGKLFTGKHEKNEKKELIILLTPHIVDGDESAIKKEKVISELAKEQSSSLEYKEKSASISRAELSSKSRKEAVAEEEERLLYSEYYLEVTNNIYDYLKKNYLDMGLKGEVNVVFLLDERGSLVGEPAVIGDVDPVVRDIAIEVVKKAAPYPVFPTFLSKQKEAFNILLSF